MKTEKMLSKVLAITLILSFVAAIPAAASAVECCPRAPWSKPARDYRDNYVKCIINALSGGAYPPATIHGLWLLLVEAADDLVANGTVAAPVTPTLLHSLIVAYVNASGYPLPTAETMVTAAEGACGWPPDPEPTTYVEIGDYCFYPAEPVSTDFNVSVIVQDVTDCKGFTVMVGYNASIITAKRVYFSDKTKAWTDAWPTNATIHFNPDRHPVINNTRTYLYQNFLGMQYVYVGCLGFPAFSGTETLVIIEFHIEVEPDVDTVTDPENRCACSPLDLFIMYDSEIQVGIVELLDSSYDPIDHAALDGHYCNIQPMYVVGYPIAVCNVYPSTAFVGDTVTFDGSSSDDGGAPPLTYMWDVGSDGTYDIVTASATSSWTCNTTGTFNVTLTVVNDMPLNDTVDEPQYWTCVEKLGTIQDLYTSPNRFCGQITPYTGEGLALNESILDPDLNPGYVDALSPDVNITLYVSVTYNGAPRMHVLVAYEIVYEWMLIDQSLGFPDGYEYIEQTIDVRTAETDKDGMAVIWFRVPMWCTGLPFGKWLVTATCKVQEVKTQDWIRFDVGYPVWLEGVETFDPETGDPEDTFEIYDCVGIKIYAKNIMFIPKEVLFVATIYDDCDVPIGLCYVEMIAPPAEEYCHPTYFVTNCTVCIPQWTYLGAGKVYVAAYTDWPRLWGAAYCPEVTTGIVLEGMP